VNLYCLIVHRTEVKVKPEEDGCILFDCVDKYSAASHQVLLEGIPRWFLERHTLTPFHEDLRRPRSFRGDIEGQVHSAVVGDNAVTIFGRDYRSNQDRFKRGVP
jgi:hypothetical protein